MPLSSQQNYQLQHQPQDVTSTTHQRRRRRRSPSLDSRSQMMIRQMKFYHHLPLVFLLVLVDHSQHNVFNLTSAKNSHHTHDDQHQPTMLAHALQPAQTMHHHQSQQQQAPQLPVFTPSNRTAALAATTTPSVLPSSPCGNTTAQVRLCNLQREQPNYKTTTACEGTTMELSCDVGKTIHLVRAIYGRFSLSICNEHGHSNYSVQCASFKSFLVLETRCNKLTSCNVTVSKDVFGDPCEGTAKYLEVQYNCEEAGQNNRLAQPDPHHVINNPNNTGRQQQAVDPTGARPTTTAPTGVHKSQAQQPLPNNVVGVGGSGPPRMPLPDNGDQLAATTTSGNNNLDNLDATGQRATQTVILHNQQQQQQQLPTSAQFCPPQTSARNLYWNFTRAGQVARQPCPDGSSGGSVSWLCDYERLRFMPALAPNFGQCRTNWLTRLSRQLDAMLESPAATRQQQQQQAASARQQDEQMIKSILGELSLLAKTNELFSEDLKRIDIMISQMIAQLRSFSVLAGPVAAGPQWWSSSSSRSTTAAAGNDQRHLVSLNPLVPTFRELFTELTSICSSLFDSAQRQAWLELASHEERARLELRLLGHLKEAGVMLAQSLAPSQLAHMQPIRQANILAGISVILDNQADDDLNLLASANNNNNADDTQAGRFGAPLSGLDSDGGELKLSSQLSTALAANGFTKFLVLDVKKPDYSLMRMQLEQQQQVAAYDQQLDNQQQQQNFAPSDPMHAQRRLFGVFAIHAETGELLGGGSSGDAASPQQDSIKRLAELMAQWPISIEFRAAQATAAAAGGGASSSAGGGVQQVAAARQCHSLSSDIYLSSQSQQPPPAAVASNQQQRQQHCHLSRYNATNFVCSCDRFGFVALSQQFVAASPSPSVFQNDAAPGFPWPSNGPYEPSLGSSDPQLQQQQQPNSDLAAPFVVNRQQAAAAGQSLGVIAYILIVFGLALMILSLSGLVVVATLRLRAGHSRLGKKHQSAHQQHSGFFDSWRTGDEAQSQGPTTGPLAAADHNLLGSDPLIGGNMGGTTHSASIIGLAHNGGQPTLAAQQQVLCGTNTNTSSSSTYKAHHHQLYAAGAYSIGGGPTQAAERSSRAWPARLLGWLLERRPARSNGWLSSAAAAAAAAASKPSDKTGLAQHQLMGGANSTLAYHAGHQLKGPYNQNQNGYTNTLGLHHQTLAHRSGLNHHHHHHHQHLGSSAGSQSGVPLNNSSNSSYVSSSAYYEEIGPGVNGNGGASNNMVTKVNASQLNPPRQFQQPSSSQHNLHHQQWQITYSAGQQHPHQQNATTFNQQQQQQQVSLITKQHLHNDLSPLQSTSSSSSAGSQQSAAHAQNGGATTPRHYLFASPIAVNAYKQQQQQFRGHSQMDGR